MDTSWPSSSGGGSNQPIISSNSMKVYAAIITEGSDEEPNIELLLGADQKALLLKLQMFFVSYWNDSQVASDAQSLEEARIFIQRICKTKNAKEIQILLKEINSDFQIEIQEQEI